MLTSKDPILLTNTEKDFMAIYQRPIVLASCTKCNGDVQSGYDPEAGWTFTCLQCGKVTYTEIEFEYMSTYEVKI